MFINFHLESTHFHYLIKPLWRAYQAFSKSLSWRRYQGLFKAFLGWLGGALSLPISSLVLEPYPCLIDEALWRQDYGLIKRADQGYAFPPLPLVLEALFRAYQGQALSRAFKIVPLRPYWAYCCATKASLRCCSKTWHSLIWASHTLS